MPKKRLSCVTSQLVMVGRTGHVDRKTSEIGHWQWETRKLAHMSNVAIGQWVDTVSTQTLPMKSSGLEESNRPWFFFWK